MAQTVLIADDHPLFREALKGAVQSVLPAARVCLADQVGSLLTLLEQEPDADLLLLDLNMPGAQGFSALVHVRTNLPTLPVIMVSARDDADTVRRALGHGAAGFVPKSADSGTLSTAIRAVLNGDRWAPPGHQDSGLSTKESELAALLSSLTPAQFRVFGLVAAGRLNKQIAYELDISEATVKAHMSAVLRKFGVNTRTQAVMLAGQLALDPSAATVAVVDEG
ncbi:DNA-binding response regulator [Ahniella affigens]|uniref:DNA-binding response regulator n=1 Tax=Ahniella affigens TaxID=2021234 RepID=A0A2P1PX88_9GAMM|nr:response regulator transcription factor [Ahniella affigens]AVP99456.1 DNA-binding response regulator [Ahniella affigens]